VELFKEDQFQLIRALGPISSTKTKMDEDSSDDDESDQESIIPSALKVAPSALKVAQIPSSVSSSSMGVSQTNEHESYEPLGVDHSASVSNQDAADSNDPEENQRTVGAKKNSVKTY